MWSGRERPQSSEPQHSKIKDAILMSGMCLSAHHFSWRVASMGDVTALRTRYASDCSGTISIPPAGLCGA